MRHFANAASDLRAPTPLKSLQFSFDIQVEDAILSEAVAHRIEFACIGRIYFVLCARAVSKLLVMNNARSISPLVIDLVTLTLIALGNVMLAARSNLVPLALGMLALAVGVRIVQIRTRIFALPLHLPLILFLISAWIGVTVSFDAALSLRKFYLIVGGIALYYVIATTETLLAKKLVAWGVVALGVSIALFFVTQNDFSQESIKFELLNRIGVLLNRLTPQFGLYTPDANLMAGILLLSAPFAVGLSYNAWREKQTALVVASALAGLVMAFGLMMTTSRGALLALALLVGVCAYLFVAARAAKRAGFSSGIGIVVAFNLLLVVVLLVTVLGGSRVGTLLGDALGGVHGVSRPLLYLQVIQLIQDYVFTGAGLDTFSPHFSTYELLIAVPFLPHAHNLYLQVWFEQGILGVLAFVWLIVEYYGWAFRRRARLNWLAVVSVAATSMMLMHGLVDVLFYFSRIISLMFIPLGLTVCALEPFRPLETKISRRVWIASAVTAALVVLLIGGIFVTRRNQVLAQWNANLGALAQAKLELPQIAFPHPTPNEVRRATDLTRAQEIFVRALRADANNRVGNARLGIIALDRAEFQNAIEFLERAYAQDKNNRAVVKALGYAYVWTNQLDRAKPLLKQINEAQIEMHYATDEWRRRDKPDLAANAAKMEKMLDKSQ